MGGCRARRPTTSVPGTFWVPLTCSRELGLYDAVVAMRGPGEHCGGGVRGFLIWSSGLSSRECPVQCRGPGRPRVQGVTGCKSSRAVLGLMFLIDFRPVAAEYGPGKGRGEFTAWLEGRWIRREAVSEAEFRRPNLEASWALSTVPMPANSYSSPELTWTKNTLSFE